MKMGGGGVQIFVRLVKLPRGPKMWISDFILRLKFKNQESIIEKFSSYPGCCEKLSNSICWIYRKKFRPKN
jgi:hypothetical protein